MRQQESWAHLTKKATWGSPAAVVEPHEALLLSSSAPVPSASRCGSVGMK